MVKGSGRGVAGEGVATAGVLGGDQLGERGVAARRPGGASGFCPAASRAWSTRAVEFGIGPGAGLVGEAAVTVLLGVQPGQGRGIAAARRRRR